MSAMREASCSVAKVSFSVILGGYHVFLWKTMDEEEMRKNDGLLRPYKEASPEGREKGGDTKSRQASRSTQGNLTRSALRYGRKYP